jgi:hypothetical protein
MPPAPANLDAPTVTMPDPAFVAWQNGHVERFRRATPPCHCFACLESRVSRTDGIRRAPFEFLTAR